MFGVYEHKWDVFTTACKHVENGPVLLVVEFEWENSSWIMKDVVIERILCQSREKWCTVFSTLSSLWEGFWKNELSIENENARTYLCESCLCGTCRPTGCDNKSSENKDYRSSPSFVKNPVISEANTNKMQRCCVCLCVSLLLPLCSFKPHKQ